MPVTDAEFNALRQRVATLEGIQAGKRLAQIRADLDITRGDIVDIKLDQDNAHAAFIQLRNLVDDLVLQLGAACERIAVLETASDPTRAAA